MDRRGQHRPDVKGGGGGISPPMICSIGQIIRRDLKTYGRDKQRELSPIFGSLAHLMFEF